MTEQWGLPSSAYSPENTAWPPADLPAMDHQQIQNEGIERGEGICYYICTYNITRVNRNVMATAEIVTIVGQTLW